MKKKKIDTFIIIMNNRITGTNLIFAEIKAKRPDAQFTAYKLSEKNITHQFRVEEKKYFNANYKNIDEYNWNE